MTNSPNVSGFSSNDKRPMELEGSLAASSLPEILQFLSLGRKSGELTLTHQSETLVITILRGKIVNTRTSSQNTQIAHMLVNRGLISQEILDQLPETRRYAGNDEKLGRFLVEQGILDPERLNDCLRFQIEEEIWPLFDAKEGEFKFENRRESELVTQPVQIDIESLIMEGTRRRDEWEVIQQIIPNDRIVLMAAYPEPLLEETLDPKTGVTVTRPKEYEPVDLRPDEWNVLAMIDGFQTVGAITRKSPIGKFETYHALYALIEGGYLQVKGEILKDRICAPDFRRIPIDHGNTSPRSNSDTVVRRATGAFNIKSLISKEANGEHPNVYHTPVSMMARFVSDCIEAFIQTPEFGNGPGEREFCFTQWQSALMTYPEADIVASTGFELNTNMFDGFVEVNGGIGRELENCSSVCLQAMMTYFENIFGLASQRLGQKGARQAIQRLLDQFRGASVIYGGDFNLVASIEDALN